jgi:hypothetical protein
MLQNTQVYQTIINLKVGNYNRVRHDSTLSAITDKLNVSAHMLVWIFFSLFGTRKSFQKFFQRLSVTLCIKDCSNITLLGIFLEEGFKADKMFPCPSFWRTSQWTLLAWTVYEPLVLISYIYICIRSDVQWWTWNLLWIHNLSLINDYLLSCSSFLSLTFITTETDVTLISIRDSVSYWLYLAESLLVSLQMQHLLGAHLNVR